MYYGWWIVVGVFLVLTVSSGFGFYNLSLYLNVLSAERAYSVAEVSVAVSLFFVVGGVTGIVVARLIERFDVRWVMIWGGLLGGAALGASAWARSLAEIYVCLTLFGVGNSAVSVVTATALITRWFPGANRSVALSVASTGYSAGGALITPLCASVLHRWGWEAAIPWFGLAFFVLVLPIALGVLRAHPPQVAASTSPNRPGPPVWGYRNAVTSRFFVLVTAAFVLCMGCQVGGISHLYNRAELVGDFHTAARAVQVLTVTSILGRFVGGWLLTRIPARPFLFACLAGQALGLGLIALAQTPLEVLAGALVFGCTVGNLLMLHPLFLAEAFPGSVYPRVFALSNAVSVLGVAVGPVLLGVLFDRFGYGAAYEVAVAGSVLAVAMVVAAGSIPLPNRHDPNHRSVAGV